MLAFQGDVTEHISATKIAAKKLGISCDVLPVRTKHDLRSLDGLIIPGGESTVLQKLCEREGIFNDLKKIKNIFGTCAGAIMLARTVHNKEEDQTTLELMDIEVSRNAYGRQTDSFEEDIQTRLGSMHAIFIRSPKIKKVGSGVAVLAKINDETIACEQNTKEGYYLASCFHPELTTIKFHEYFLKKCTSFRSSHRF